MLEIVLVEMKATHEVVGGLGKWAPRQKVSEKLSYPALLLWEFLLSSKEGPAPCLQSRRGSGAFRKWGPLDLYPSLCV